MKRTGLSGYIIRSLLVIFGFVALISLISYFLCTRKFHMAIKTNRYETVKTTQKKVFSSLMEGAGIYFFNKYLPTWKKGVQQTRKHKREQKQLLHYKLQIEHIIDTDPTKRTNHERPTIYLHGWGDTKHSAKLLKAFCDVLPGDIITFQFRDHGVFLAKLKYSNLGQLPDVLSTIYAIKWTKDNLHAKEVDLFGYSRGGATLLNTLAVLNDKSEKYDADLEKIGVTSHERKELLAMIQRGCHVLDCPLTDMNVTIKQFMKKKMGSKSPFWLKAFEALTRYKRDGLQGLSSANALAGLKLNILTHFQHKDSIVSNKNETELYKRLYKHNPRTTFMVLGNNGGHLHSHSALAQTVHTFKKKFGGSYDPEYTAQYESTKNDLPIANRLLCPGSQVEQTISRYYEECHKKEKLASALKK